MVQAMWDHGAMSHGCQGVEGMGAMRWTWEGCMGGGCESGEGGAGGHAPALDGAWGHGHGKGAWGGGGGESGEGGHAPGPFKVI